MRVILAETAGFCMGVDLALTKLDLLLGQDQNRPIVTLGPIIHNPQVLDRYAEQGVDVAQAPEAISRGSHVVIRAHGVPRQVEESLAASGMRVTDATCPRVKKAQVLIARHTGRDGGRTLLLYGENEHPEVQGLLSYAQGPALVFDSMDALRKLDLKPGSYVLAAQTTQDRSEFTEITQYLADREDLDVDVLATICDATRLRQREAMEIAEAAQAMVVVGGRMSGNTRRLVQVCLSKGKPCYHVETPDELPLDELKGLEVVGLTAGASTPADLIEAVQESLERL